MATRRRRSGKTRPESHVRLPVLQARARTVQYGVRSLLGAANILQHMVYSATAKKIAIDAHVTAQH